MSSLSPTQRTLAFLRAAGYIAEVVERHNAYAGPPHAKCPGCGKNKIGVKQDFLGWCDIIAFHPTVPGVLGVQCTSGSNLSARRAKVVANVKARAWVEAKNRIWLMGWKPDAKDPRLEEMRLADFPSETVKV